MLRLLGGSVQRPGRRAGAACHTWAQPLRQSLPPGWGGGMCGKGALAGLEVEGRILLTAPTPCDRAQSPVSVALLLEGKRLSLPPLLPPAPSITPRSRGHPGRPWDPKNAPPGLAIPQLLPEEGGGAAGRVSRRSPHPPYSPNPLCFPLSFLSRLQSTYRCGAVGRNQGAQVRNGAWQPLACTRLPECNFPVITLPNFSASVKNQLLTRRSQAHAGQDASPFARNHFPQAEKTHSLFSFRHGQCPLETSRGPRPVVSGSPESGRLPPSHPPNAL